MRPERVSRLPMRPHPGLLAALLAAALLLLPCAAAHAALVAATPLPNGYALEGTARLELRWTERVDPATLEVVVIDQQGEDRVAGAPQVEGVVATVPLEPLGRGLYSAAWSARSLDGHASRGSFAFAVGDAALPWQPPVAARDAAPDAMAATTADAVTRATFLVGLVLALGLPLAAVALRRHAPAAPLAATAAAFALAAALAALLPLAEVPAPSHAGRARLAEAAALGAVAVSLGLAAVSASAAARRLWTALALAAGAAAVVVAAWGSPAAALADGRATGTALAAAGLVAAAMWIGAALGALHPAGGTVAGPRLAAVSMVAAPLLALAWAAAILLPIACGGAGEPACAEPPQRALRHGVAAAGVAVVAVAAWAAWRGRARPAAARGPLVAQATLLMVLVLGTGVLAAVPAADPVVAQGDQTVPAFAQEATTRTAHVVLQVRPADPVVGNLTLRVLVHPWGPTLPPETGVTLVLRAPDGAERTVVPTKVTPNEWEAQDEPFPSAGEWVVTLVLDHPEEQAEIPFTVPVRTSAD